VEGSISSLPAWASGRGIMQPPERPETRAWLGGRIGTRGRQAQASCHGQIRQVGPPPPPKKIDPPEITTTPLVRVPTAGRNSSRKASPTESDRLEGSRFRRRASCRTPPAVLNAAR
jgi:hypothetical protein